MAMKPFAPDADMVMGHEFCCEVVDLGPGVSNLAVGDVVVSLPVAFDGDGLHPLGFSNRYPGGYAEMMVLNEMTGIKVPAGLPPRMAAMTEPLAVGVHAVNKSRIVPGEAAVVLGCGPVGLACIADLRMKGIGPIVAADFSPRRRALAEHLGADVVVDPREDAGDRGLATDRRRQAVGDLRGRRRARHARPGDAHGAARRTDPRGRRLHAAGPRCSRSSASARN